MSRGILSGGFCTGGFCPDTFLTTGYCSRTIGYCFLEIFVGGQGLDGGVQSRDREDPSSPSPLGTILVYALNFETFRTFRVLTLDTKFRLCRKRFVKENPNKNKDVHTTTGCPNKSDRVLN